MKENIILERVETNNLKEIDVTLVKNAINLIIGPSGSGKSSLAYDTVAQIGQHEFASMFADNVPEPTYRVRSFSNMVAAVPIKQTNHNNNLRSTIGTYFGLSRSIGLVYAAELGVSEDIFVLNKESNLCPECHGLGTTSVLDEIRIVDYGIPLEKDPFKCWNRYKDFYSQIIKEYCIDQGIDPGKTFRELTAAEKKTVLYGESEKKYSIRYKNGDLDAGQEYLSNDITVVDEFADGKECDRLYDKVYAAKLRLLEKLGTDENPDIEEIINCMSDISKILAMKMYDYGVESR